MTIQNRVNFVIALQICFMSAKCFYNLNIYILKMLEIHAAMLA